MFRCCGYWGRDVESGGALVLTRVGYFWSSCISAHLLHETHVIGHFVVRCLASWNHVLFYSCVNSPPFPPRGASCKELPDMVDDHRVHCLLPHSGFELSLLSVPAPRRCTNCRAKCSLRKFCHGFSGSGYQRAFCQSTPGIR